MLERAYHAKDEVTLVAMLFDLLRNGQSASVGLHAATSVDESVSCVDYHMRVHRDCLVGACQSQRFSSRRSEESGIVQGVGKFGTCPRHTIVVCTGALYK